jgi:hypothetical protein
MWSKEKGPKTKQLKAAKNHYPKNKTIDAFLKSRTINKSTLSNRVFRK